MNEKLSAISKRKKQLQLFSIFFVVCGIAIIFLLSAQPVTGLFLALALIVLYLFLFRRKTKDYRQAVKQAMLEEGLRPFLKNISYQQKDGVPRNTILDAGLLPNENLQGFLIRDTVQGTYQARPVFITDITTDFLTVKEQPGSSPKTVTDFMSGCYFDIQLRSDNANYILWSKKLVVDKNRAPYLSRKTPFPAPGLLADAFLLYVAPGAGVPDISEETEKVIHRLMEYTPGEVCLQVSGGHLRVFIRNRFLFTFHVPGRTEMTAKILSANPFPEMPYLLRIADTLLQ